MPSGKKAEYAPLFDAMGEIMKKFDITALGEILIDFTPAGKSQNGRTLFEENPGGATANVAAAAALCVSRSPHWRLFPKRKSSSLLFPASAASSRDPCEELCEIVIAGMHFIPRIREVYGKSGGFKLCCAVNGFGAF